jgi:hypothetical protein
MPIIVEPDLEQDQVLADMVKQIRQLRDALAS